MNLTRNLWCIGRNYADHAQEMQVAVPTPATSDPLIFLKSGDCLSTSTRIQLPTWSQEIHYELELAFLLDENLGASHITLALDLTARDAQARAKKMGQPWTLAKSFRAACPIGPWVSLADLAAHTAWGFQLEINGQVVQSGNSSQMIFPLPRIRSFLLERFPVQKHDVLLTGTPAGVGPLTSGQALQAQIWDVATPHKKILTCTWDVE
jgi:acylpyruvate hydrolase